MTWSERIYRRLLHLYPRDFRDEYGEEMSLLFRAGAGDGIARLCLQVFGDLSAIEVRHRHASSGRAEN